MAMSGWFYSVPHFDVDGVRLTADGSAILAGRRFRDGEAIDITFDGHHAIRKPGPEQYLIIHRAAGGIWCFVFDKSGWQRFAPAYWANPLRYGIHDLVLKWGVGAPLVVLAAFVGGLGVLCAIGMLFFDWKGALYGAFCVLLLAGGVFGSAQHK